MGTSKKLHATLLLAIVGTLVLQSSPAGSTSQPGYLPYAPFQMIEQYVDQCTARGRRGTAEVYTQINSPAERRVVESLVEARGIATAVKVLLTPTELDGVDSEDHSSEAERVAANERQREVGAREAARENAERLKQKRQKRERERLEVEHHAKSWGERSEPIIEDTREPRYGNVAKEDPDHIGPRPPPGFSDTGWIGYRKRVFVLGAPITIWVPPPFQPSSLTALGLGSWR